MLLACLGLALHESSPLHAQAGTTGGTPQRGSFKKQVRPGAGKPTSSTTETKREQKLPPDPKLTGGVS